MTIESTASERLWSLTEAACSEMISDDQVRELETILQTDEQARAFYFAYCELHADVHAVVTEDRAMSAVREMLASDDLLEAENPSAPPVLGFLGGAVRWTHEYFSQPGPFSILAAAIFMVCMISILSILPAPTYQPSHSNHACTTSTSGTGLRGVDKDGKFKFVARVTGLHNCKWSDNYLPPLRYAHLGLGRELKLDAGLVEITYYNGAKLVLEGPVEFTVEKANACRLELGKLAAKVPKPAAGFTVETPGMSVVDLGTEFSVMAEESGSTEVHIFIGEVEVQQPGRNGAVATVQRLKAGQAIRCTGGGFHAIPLSNRYCVRNMSQHAAVSTLLASAVAASTFDVDDEGWTVSVDGTDFTHHATGGVPGGYIHVADQTTGETYYFIAPSAFHGDQSGAYGACLSFNLRVRYVGEPNRQYGKVVVGQEDDVVIVGNGKTIVVRSVVRPKLDRWAHCRIALDPSGGWRRADMPERPTATDQDILEVLSNIEQFRIRGEFITGKDVADLDNVIIQRGKQ